MTEEINLNIGNLVAPLRSERGHVSLYDATVFARVFDT